MREPSGRRPRAAGRGSAGRRLPPGGRLREASRLLERVVLLLALASGCWGEAPAAASYTPRNLDDSVGYVGEAACAACHPKQARTYPGTAMGRSLAPIATLLQNGSLGLPPGGVTFLHEKSHTKYRIFVDNGVLKHSEIRLDEHGRELFTDTRTMLYALGSGDRARTFLLQEGDRLYQSPIAYRPHRDGWGMAAGYDVPVHYHFERTVVGACLFCHANRASFVEGTLNRYGDPVFDGFHIGCERCHGPGGLHVDERRSSPPTPDGIDETIVNPARLPDMLRDSVCFQCHLQGSVRVVKPGHPLYAFRPGLPLSDYFAVFHARSGEQGIEVISHVDRLRESQCFRRSGGRINCLTCHDPHHTPKGEEAVRQFRAACLTCHQVDQCSRPDGMGHGARGGDPGDCVSCHMIKMPPTDAPHTLFTDHLIARRPHAPGVAEVPAAGDVGLENLLEGAGGQARDRGVASMLLAYRRKDPRYARMAMTILEPLLPDLSHDVEALRSMANYYERAGRMREAAGVLETLVANAPRKTEYQARLARRYFAIGRRGRALSLARQAVQADPSYARARLVLADILAASRDLPAAEENYRAALRFDPALAGAHAGLGEAAMRRNDPASAEKHFRQALALDPSLRSARLGMTRIHMSRSDVPAALEELTDGIARAADRRDAAALRFMLAVVLRSAGRSGEAIEELEKILAEFPGQKDARALMRRLRGPSAGGDRP